MRFYRVSAVSQNTQLVSGPETGWLSSPLALHHVTKNPLQGGTSLEEWSNYWPQRPNEASSEHLWRPAVNHRAGFASLIMVQAMQTVIINSGAGFTHFVTLSGCVTIH